MELIHVLSKKRKLPQIIAMEASNAVLPTMWKIFRWKLGNTSVIVRKW